ncbi:BtrH N-terminal domain-containing protein [Haladaptatus sp. DYSN1]|uniref:BtrH N-terminal domain-containing protein n=1 Tax=unclassified Haladaptatus TaxID=2622732 RepID=UPI0024074A36|nr:BtrH N-terminal domain-containing protein [Haladaptatus sp. DYSN1]
MHLSGYTHETGHHCGSTSLRNLSDFYGWGLSEAECFGLASGLGFTYFITDEPPYRAFFGRPVWLESAFFANLDIPHEEREGQSHEEAWAAVEAAIDGGDPVMCFVDLFYLDYYNTDTHFSPHTVLLVGYDDESVQISDSEFDEVQTLSREQFDEAWTSQAMVSLARRHIVVTDPEPRASIEQAMRQAIRTTAAYMQDPESAPWSLGGVNTAHGLPGIRRFADELPGFPDLGAFREITWTARFAYQNVERRGTGGGTFRRLYAAFLASMAEQVPELDDSHGERMRQIAADWTAVGEQLKAASKAEDEADLRAQLTEIGDAVSAIATKEESLLTDLESLV